MLLARLQRHAQRGAPGPVLGDADDAAGQMPFVRLARREERGVRATVGHGNPEPLAVPDGHVGSPLTRRHEQCQREQIGRRGDERARRVRALAQRPEIAQPAVRARILHQGADHPVAETKLLRVAHDDLDAPRFGPRADHRDRLRMALLVDAIHRAPFAACHGLGDVHRLGGGGRLVEQRRIGHVEPGQVRDHRLEIQQRLESSLGDLRLIRRVGRVPAGILQHVALDDLGREAGVIAHAEVGPERLVLTRDAAQRLQHLALVPAGRQCERAAQPDVRRHDGVDERVQRIVAQEREHLLLLIGTRPDVAETEDVGMNEVGGAGHELQGLGVRSQGCLGQ